MSDFLAQMARASAARAAAIRGAFRSSDFDQPLVPLALERFDVIAEIKERSPAEGVLAAAGDDRAERARRYVAGGAAAISVLTEPQRFRGALEHLRQAVAAVDGAVPVMRKDFLVASRQVEEARSAGASGVLLIAAIQDDRALRAMLACAFDLGLFVLLECFDEDDLLRAAKLMESDRVAARALEGGLLIGVNARNLRTLAVEPDRLRSLASRLPEGAVCVAESGLRSADDAGEAAALGYRMALVGTALMRAAEPADLLRRMLRAGRDLAA